MASQAEKDLIQSIIQCYTTKSYKTLASLYESTYSNKAHFIDPFVHACPAREARLQFAALQRIFSKVTAATAGNDISVTHLQDHRIEISFPCVFEYFWAREGKISKWLFPESTQVIATVRLEIDENSNKILVHEDIWHRPEMAIALPDIVRRLNATASNALFRLLGWENDELKSIERGTPGDSGKLD